MRPSRACSTRRSRGFIFHIAHDRLVAAAEEADCAIEIVAPVGDFVPAGAALMRIDPPGAPLRSDVLQYVGLGPERTMNQDLAYGIRMLVDIAERGLSEPFLDPTTAVQAIDRLHDCLRQLVDRPFPDGRHHDAEGRVRLIVPTLDWAGYVDLAFDEIRCAGRLSPQVPRRLAAALDDLIDIAPDDRRPPLERQRRLLDRDAEGGDPVPDRQGIGSGADVMVPVDAL